MKVSKFTIKTDQVFLFSCVCDKFTPEAENGFKSWLMDYFKNQCSDKGVSIFTKYEHPALLAIAVVDINEDQEAGMEEIDTQEL